MDGFMEKGWKATLISTIRYMKVDAEEGKYELMPGVYVLVGRRQIDEYLTPEFLQCAGVIEFKHFKSADHLIVGELDRSIVDCDGASNLILMFWLVWLEWLLCDSWLVLDNAFLCEIAYCKVTDGKNTEWSNNSLQAKFSDWDGGEQFDTLVTSQQLEKWNDACEKVRSKVYSNGVGILTSFDSRSYSRFGRFHYFVAMARKSAHPAMKIAQMCSALESMFSTDTVELSHRLSERVALFLGEIGFDREKTYQEVKRCYGVRSQVTHGAYVKVKEEEVSALSFRLAELLREISWRVMSEEPIYNVFAGSNESIEAYFRRLLFGPRQ